MSVMRYFSVTLRLAIAAMMFGSIIWQIADRVAHNLFRPTEYFEYFTIQTGLISATVTLISGLLMIRGARESMRWSTVRLSVVTYEIVVGIIYNLLLRDAAPDARDVGYDWPPLPNELLHVWAPILIALDWVLSTGVGRIAFKRVWWVLTFPFAWIVLMFLRGFVDSWYPYWFFDPTESTPTTILIYFFGILFFMIAVGFAMVALRRLAERWAKEQANS